MCVIMAYYDETPKKITFNQVHWQPKRKKVEQERKSEVSCRFEFLVFSSLFVFFSPHRPRHKDFQELSSRLEDWLWLRLHAPFKNPPNRTTPYNAVSKINKIYRCMKKSRSDPFLGFVPQLLPVGDEFFSANSPVLAVGWSIIYSNFCWPALWTISALRNGIGGSKS